MNECIKLNLKQCKACKWKEIARTDRVSICWIEHFEKIIKNLSDKNIKEYFIDYNRFHDPDWTYYYNNAVIKCRPEKKHIIEKLMVLL
jgi:hypothetical protein